MLAGLSTIIIVTGTEEMECAVAELAGGGPTSYVMLRVDEGEYTSANRGNDLRRLIDEQHFLCPRRPPPSGRRLRKAVKC